MAFSKGFRSAVGGKGGNAGFKASSHQGTVTTPRGSAPKASAAGSAAPGGARASASAPSAGSSGGS